MTGRMGSLPHIYSKCIVRLSRAEDVDALAPRMRKADVYEVEAYSGKAAAAVLLDSFENAKQCLSIEDRGGSIIAMFGVGWTSNPRVGRIWLLGSPEIAAIKSAFLAQSRQYAENLLNGHDVVFNHVHDGNLLSIRWLQWLGFQATGSPTGVAAEGERFTEYAKFASQPMKTLYLKRDWQAFLEETAGSAVEERAPGSPGAPASFNTVD